MGQLLHSYTFRLFAKKGSSPFIEGAASILNLSDSEHLYNYDNSDKEADHNSLRADWLQIGQDLQNVIEEHAALHANEPTRKN